MSDMDFRNDKVGVIALFNSKFRDFPIFGSFSRFLPFLAIFCRYEMGPPDHLFGHKRG